MPIVERIGSTLMKSALFGIMPDGAPVEEYTLRKGSMMCKIITYGGALRCLEVPDRFGMPVDVALGYDALTDYLRHDKFFGALVGRCANRIGGSEFALKGESFRLRANEGKNHLHGGARGFHARVWTVKAAAEDEIVLTYVSPDGEEGYPGELRAEVAYRLDGDSLSIDYHAVSDRATLCNLTNHTYFNLSGHGRGTVENHIIEILADYYTPIDGESIPTGRVAGVGGTPMDLRTPVPIGAGIDAEFEQLRLAGGYDHNWVVRGGAGSLRPAAVAVSPDTGIAMRMYTTQPGVQFYTGNYLAADPNPPGKAGVKYGKRSGFCLEAQAYPDSPHHENFPSVVLEAGAVYRQTTVYAFSAAPKP